MTLSVVLLATVSAAVFEPIWARPLIQRYVFERSGRHIDFDELHVRFDRDLQPIVRLRNLRVENASWAAAQPLARAAGFDFTLAWESLRGERVVVTRLVLVDAELDLEHRADGLRNWRITRPDDRGPGNVRVKSIDARGLHARVVNQGLGLEFDLRAAALPTPSALPGHADLPLTKQLDVNGTRDGAAFEVHAAVSDVMTFSGTDRPFAVRGEVRTGAAHASAQGLVTDLLQPARLDLDVQLARLPLDVLGAALGLPARLPSVPSEAAAHVLKSGPTWTVSQLRARLGRSDFAGDAQLVQPPAAEGRAMLRATLASERLDVGEWRLPRSSASTPGAASAPLEKPAAKSPTRSPAKVPARPLATATPARRLDADIDLKIASVEGLPLGTATGLTAHAALREGRLAFEPFGFAAAGGHVAGALTFDSARAPAEVALDLRVRGLQIERLARRLPGLQPVSGALDMVVALRSHGDSVANLAAAASGTLKAELVRATIPEALDAKLGLDGGHLLRTMIGPEQRTPVTCSAIEFRFDNGRGAVRRLAFETEHVLLGGTGWVDLGRESFELLLTPRRKHAALFAIDRSMRVGGPFGAAKLALVDPVEPTTGTADTGSTPAVCAPGTAH